MDIIIGAGISGLSYAAFRPGGDYLVLEAEDRMGGYCKTTRRNGFVWDYSGHFFHFRQPDIKDFVMHFTLVDYFVTGDAMLWYVPFTVVLYLLYPLL